MDKYFDNTINIDFQIPDYLVKTIENLINERKQQGLHVDFYEEDFISDCNKAYNDGIINIEQVKLLREKYLGG